jgi:hypothetical protein
MRRGAEYLSIITTQLYEQSLAARRVARNADVLYELVKRDPRKILPATKLARSFSVSVRLLNKWTERGFLKREKRNESYRKGIAKNEAVRFLNRLKKVERDLVNYDFDLSPPAAGRPQSAMRKIRAARRTVGFGHGTVPREFAGRVGVSRASVMRAIKDGILQAWNPTPHRFVIGTRPRNRKNFRNQREII